MLWPSVETLVALYNGLIPQYHPRVDRVTPARRDKAKKYLAIFPERSFWVRVFTEVRFSKFLRGHKNNPNGDHGHFRGDFDWLLTKGKDGTENAIKVAEGKYRDEESR